jgi:hypothetical protein
MSFLSANELTYWNQTVYIFFTVPVFLSDHDSSIITDNLRCSIASVLI